MRGNALAHRYAHALFAQAQQENALEPVLADLAELVNLLEPAQVQQFFGSPRISQQQKREVLSQVTEHVHPLLRRFLELLLRRRRMSELAEVQVELLRLQEESSGVERATVTSAVPLDTAQMEKLHGELRRLTGKEVVLQPQLKPEIGAGVIVEMGDYLIDGSLSKEIRDLRDRLRSVRVG